MLTAEQVRGMEAGAEMDAAVARALDMRATDFVCPRCGSTHFGTSQVTGKTIIFCHGDVCRWSGTWDDVPWSPSTNIEHAWQVVEKMRKDNALYSISPSGDSEEVWRCVVWRNGNREFVYAQTAPLAITRAALLSAGVANPPAGKSVESL